MKGDDGDPYRLDAVILSVRRDERAGERSINRGAKADACCGLRNYGCQVQRGVKQIRADADVGPLWVLI